MVRFSRLHVNLDKEGSPIQTRKQIYELSVIKCVNIVGFIPGAAVSLSERRARCERDTRNESTVNSASE